MANPTHATIGRRLEAIEVTLRATDRKEAEAARTDLQNLARLHALIPDAEVPQQTIPQLFGREYDENFISDYLAVFLDPGRNGIGIEPLQALVRLADETTDISQADRVHVERERWLGNGEGRIDLLITVDEDLVIGLENKVLSPEGTKQTPTYARTIHAEFSGRKIVLLFLTPKGIRPKSQKFVPVSYPQLREVFSEIHYRWLDAPRLALLWEDFQDYIREVFDMSNGPPVFSEKTHLYLEHISMIEDLRKTFDAEAARVIEFARARLETKLGGDWVMDFKSTRGWQAIYRRSWWRDPSLYVHYEWWMNHDSFGRKDLYFMVEAENKESKVFLEHFEAGVYPGHEASYEAKGIRFRPENRRQAVAFKCYPIDWKKLLSAKDPAANFVKLVEQSWEEFEFFGPLVDDALKTLDDRQAITPAKKS